MRWLLISTYHPNFNIWKNVKANYYECFWKGEDPNKRGDSDGTIK